MMGSGPPKEVGDSEDNNGVLLQEYWRDHLEEDAENAGRI